MVSTQNTICFAITESLAVVGDSTHILPKLLQKISDKWVSPLHRVVVAAPPHDDGQDHQRRSIAFFVNINGDAVVETLPSCVDDENPIKYKPITAGQYMQHKYLKSMGKEE